MKKNNTNAKPIEYKITKQFLPNVSYSVLIWFAFFMTTLFFAAGINFVPQFKQPVVLWTSLLFVFVLTLVPYIKKKQTDVFNAKCCVCKEPLYGKGQFYYQKGIRLFCKEDGEFIGLTEQYIFPSLYEKLFVNDLIIDSRMKYLKGETVRQTILDLDYAQVNYTLVGKYKRVCQTVKLIPSKLKKNERNMGIVLLTNKKSLDQEIIIAQDLKQYLAKKDTKNHVRLLVECKMNDLKFWEAYFIEMYDTYNNGTNNDSGSYELFNKEQVRIILNSRRAIK